MSCGKNLRPTEAAARKTIEAWLGEHTPGYPTYSLCEDGDDSWAFWVADLDTTSYVHEDLAIEWYGTGWPEYYAYNGDDGMWSEIVQASARTDVLDMAYINSLPQPFVGRELGGWEWPVNDFEVGTGLLRIDVCGLLQVKSIADFTSFRDGDGVQHPAEGFYADAAPEDRIVETGAKP